MKTRFSTIDLIAALTEIKSKLLGLRVQQIYDVDHKTYLFRFQKPDEKAVLVIESGIRLHTTVFEWPKNAAPSGFSMKLRKHLRNKRLEMVQQLGIDRIVDLQFGTNEAAYHVIIELYDRGNIVLTDYEYNILNILRPRTEGEDVRFAVREKYLCDRARQHQGLITTEKLQELLLSSKEGDNIRKALNPHLDYGPAVIHHALLKSGFSESAQVGKDVNIVIDVPRLLEALIEAENVLKTVMAVPSKGYIIQKEEIRPNIDGQSEEFYSYQEFHPFLFKQHENQSYVEFDSFDQAVDEFFSKVESQKLDMKAVHQEKEALKKLENVRKDHEMRLEGLQKAQEADSRKAELIEMNLELVNQAILVVRSAIANQMDWRHISEVIRDAQSQNDPVACKIKGLKLEVNNITMLLSNPYIDREEHADWKPYLVDIDLDLTAYANARKYYDKKRFAAKKEHKTIDSSAKAYKNAEKKTRLALKEMSIIANINKARKTFWFEKFFWFISSENYLVIGGRDQQQNELIVKRYMRSTDLYVHADIHGASSIIIKNPGGGDVPPKTLNEAGTMAICYSTAWEARVVTSAWWVYASQVSKTAPTGEYLTTGSFMVRGKKNYLPPSQLIMGFGFLFRLDEDSVPRHANERKVRMLDEDASVASSSTVEDTETHLEFSDGSTDDGGEEEEEGANKKSDEDTEEEEFPDTMISIEHLKGDQFALRTRTTSGLSGGDEQSSISLGDEESVIVNTGREQRKMKQKKHRVQKLEAENVPEDDSQATSEKSGAPKRGQKSKLRKIKKKYKDQDEEERELRMKIVQPAGNPKESKKKKGKKSAVPPPVRGSKPVMSKPASEKPNLPSSVWSNSVQPEVEEVERDEDEEEITEKEEQVMDDVNMLTALTGIPVTEDELLFAVPVVGPYNALQNYKFKVKLIPGTGRRGKGTKTALHMFQQDKSASGREKELVKSVKDQDLARNIPGKIKVSAPQIKKAKR